ncbi:uncharacterized protein PV09_03370 [Verruconis gallopava]|uniref:UDENN domain-containing protein n=1 Tax=Verruconis gallopava TaxID=253628 RepID=A0A0D1XS21_9PEZI|nr:uncharacterized protein PV09_03370 [Verruconis gallopava]KIW05486.1 hypothetical protein PV09_03370 [Verruconis gallopava]
MEKLKRVLHPRRESAQIGLDSADEPISIDWLAFRQWAICFVVCNFNVDVGPEVEILYPPDTAISPSDLTAICFNSFPERHDNDPLEVSNGGTSGRQARKSTELAFNFSIRNNSPDLKLYSPAAPHGSANTLFGSCLFRSEFDSQTKRSFNQKSLVLISNHNFAAFHLRLLRILTEFGVISDPSKLEAASSEIAQWPAPTVGHQDLPFLGYLLQLEITPHRAFHLQGLTPPHIYAYEPTGSWDLLLQHMHSIGELYIAFERLFLCESIVVYARSPQLCSEGVSCLADLIAPVPYAGVRKPYLTMQSEFFSQDKTVPQRFLIGITNPFLLKRLTSAAKEAGQPLYILQLKDTPGPVQLKGSRSHRGKSRGSELDIPGGLDPQEPVKRYLKSDHDFLNTVDLTLKHPDPTVAPIGPFLRRHFADLTGQILQPLNRFLTTEMTSTPLSPGGNPRYANFSQKDFLHSLSKHGTLAKFRGQTPLQAHRLRDGFYEQFVRSPNFYSYLEMRVTLDSEARAGLLRGNAVIVP